MHPLVTTDWLADNLTDPDLRVVDATWYLPINEADAEQEFEDAHIAGSVYLNISDVCDKTQSAPHMLPASAQFATQASALGLGSDHTIIVYDKGEYAAARRDFSEQTAREVDCAVRDLVTQAFERAVGRQP